MSDQLYEDPFAHLCSRIDDVGKVVGGMAADIKVMREKFSACHAVNMANTETLRGNGKDGLVSKVAVLESEAGRMKTADYGERISVRSMLALLAAVGAFASIIGGVIGTVVAAIMS